MEVATVPDDGLVGRLTIAVCRRPTAMYRLQWESTMRLIKKFLMAGAVASLAAVAVVGTAGAAPVGACPSANLSTYVVTGFTCTIGDKTFSNFIYNPGMSGTGTASPATSVAVTPLGAPNYGFTFTGIWNSGSSGTGDGGLSYTVAVSNGQALIDSAVLSLVGSLTGTGSAGTVGETLCLNPSCSLSDVLSVSLAGAHSDSTTFAPVSIITVMKDIDAMSSGSGTASISVVTNTVDQLVPHVPEPASLALLGSALIGFGAFRRRRKAA